MRRTAVRYSTHALTTPALLAGALTASLALTACGGASNGSDASGGSAAAGSRVTVTATDTSCVLSSTALKAGVTTFSITNTGSRVTEFELLDPTGKRIFAEKENIAPQTTYALTAEVSTGSYLAACMPGQTAPGIRTPVTFTAAAAGATTDPTAAKAISAYRTYVEGRVDALVPLVKGFAAAVKSGDVAKAKKLYAPSRVPWEAIEPVAEAFGDIDPKVDTRRPDLEPGQRWTGWHRIEKGLWVDRSTKGLTPYADQLVTEIGDLKSRVGGAKLTVASIGNGAKELLDEVAASKITGEEEAYSHTDLVDFAANVAGAHTAYEVLKPLVQRNDRSLVTTLDQAFGDVDAALAKYAKGSGYVSYQTVSPAGRRELARVVDALGQPLSQLAATAAR